MSFLNFFFFKAYLLERRVTLPRDNLKYQIHSVIKTRMAKKTKKVYLVEIDINEVSIFLKHGILQINK